MATKYLYQNKKRVGLIWNGKNKTAQAVIIGSVLVAVVAVGIAYMKQPPAARQAETEPFYSWEKAAHAMKPIPKLYKCGDPGVVCF